MKRELCTRETIRASFAPSVAAMLRRPFLIDSIGKKNGGLTGPEWAHPVG
jgi:hypothetical protein